MNKELAKTALAIRHAIVPAEESTDSVMGKLGLLLHETCEARRELGVSTARSQEVLAMIIEAAGHQLAVRDTTLRLHERYGSFLREIAPEYAAGDNGCPPVRPSATLNDELSPLRAVA